MRCLLGYTVHAHPLKFKASVVQVYSYQCNMHVFYSASLYNYLRLGMSMSAFRPMANEQHFARIILIQNELTILFWICMTSETSSSRMEVATDTSSTPSLSSSLVRFSNDSKIPLMLGC